ncbi:unnamed protein product [Mytilus edulis]|uniref:Uncharacterized protein n=1 Tax=Mytilus edulis TaxID=6550 RepID=A0A8S3PXA6_MYTED|nr:unnamed protein product [Mytilus edulis]
MTEQTFVLNPKQNIDFSWDKCLCHRSGEKGNLKSFSDKTWTTFKAAAESRNDRVSEIMKGKWIDGPKGVYHKKCYQLYTMKRDIKLTLKRNTCSQKRKLESDSATKHAINVPAAKLPRNFDKSKCVICLQDKTSLKDRRRLESLTKCLTDEAIETMKQASTQQDTNPLLIKRLESGFDFFYHKSCFRILTSVLYKENETQVEEEPDSFTSAFDILAKEVQQNIIHGLQVSNLTDLCSRFRELLLTQGVHVLKYNPTRLKARLVNEFGDNLTFWRSGRQNSLLVFCSSVPTGQIVQTAIESSTLVQSNDTLNAAVGKEDIVTTVFYAAKAIRNVISLDSKSNIPWPPTGESISEDNIVIPDLLYNFLALVLTDDSTHASISPSKLDISSEVLHRRIMSLAQDLIYSVSKGYTKTPKHVALAIYLKTQTGSSEIVKIINRFGHSVSYDQVEEIETAIAEKMIMNTEDDIFIPSIIRKGVFSSFCWDNNDLCEETLSGQGTTHCTNGIVIQTRPDWCENEDEANQTPLQRSKNRSLKIVTEEQPVHIYSKTRVGPKTNFSKQTHNSFQSLSLVSRKKDFCFLLCRMSLLDNLFLLDIDVSQCIPTWTAFNIMTDHTNVPRANSIGYLQVIDASPTDLNTVTTVLQRSVSIADKLGQRDVVIVFDQAIYAKALEIIWQKPVEFERVVLRMGAFHTACAFIAVIGKRFGDAGLGDLLLESGVIGSCSLTGVLEGKHYNRALRLHKIVFEAFERLRWEAFGSWLNSNDENEFLDPNFQHLFCQS